MHQKSSKDFLFLHFEKFIFAVLVLAAVFLIYRGMQMPDYLQKEQPDRLEQGANQVKSSIDEDHWESMNEAESRLPTMDVVGRTNQSISPIPMQPYQLEHPWERKAIDMAVKRIDPVIAAPLKLQVSGVVASLAVKSRSQDPYPLQELENAEKVAAAPEQPGRRRGNPRRGGAMDGMGPGGYEGMMSYEGMMDGYGSGSMLPESSGSMPGGPMGAGVKPPIQVNAQLFDQGFRPTGVFGGGMTSMSPGSGSGSSSGAGSAAGGNRVEPVMGHFIAGVALMPHKELFKTYMDAFQQADGFNPMRDRPTYIGFQLERADVTDRPVDSLTDSDWVRRGTSRYYHQLHLQVWAGAAKEIVTGKYRDPELTVGIPPVLLDNYADFASHPDIPVGDEPLVRLNPLQQQDTGPVGPIVPGVDDEPFAAGNLPPASGGQMYGSSGMYGSEAMYGSGSGSAYGSGSGGMYGSGGMPGYGGMGATLRVEDQADYKLIRFYDFRDFSGNDRAAPVPGRQYVYRLRVAVEDPNFPRIASLQPRSGSLSSEVFRRVEAETAKAAQSPTAARNSVRWSEFSEPSDVVSLPATSAAYAGLVTPGQFRKMQAGGREVDVMQRPPTGKMVISRWDPTYLVPIPAELEVTRGAVLAKQGDANVPDPLALIVKKLPDANVNTQGVLVDLAGGEKLMISADEGQVSPSLMLWFTPDGGLQLSDDIHAMRDYRLYTTPDEKPVM